MARDIRDEIEGLFKQAAEDPSLGDAPPKKRPPTKAPPSAGAPAAGSTPQRKGTGAQTPATAPAPAGKPRVPTTIPPPQNAAPRDRSKAPTDPPLPAAAPKIPQPTLPPQKKSASAITPELLRRTGGGPGSVITSSTLPPGTNTGSIGGSSGGPSSGQTGSLGSPSVNFRSAPSSPARSAPAPRAKPSGARKEMIEYSADEPLVDHKGRSKPMYKPRSPRPRSWKPSRPIRLLLGMFPGTRLMALETVAQGWPYTALGMFALVPAIFLMLGWVTMAETITSLRIDDRWLLVHAAAIVCLVAVFELLRLGAYFEEKLAGPRVPRVLAAITLPALLIVLGAPRLVSLWPQLVEAAWCAAVVLTLGGVAGSAWCLLDGTMTSTSAQKTFRIAGLVLIVALIVAGVATGVLVPGTFGKISGALRAIGFQKIPEILGS